MAAGYRRGRGFSPTVDQLDPERFLPFEPKNEAGVFYVFALVAKTLGFDVQTVQVGFPDCRAAWGGKRMRIEFEYRSSNFERHGHDVRGCDLVVCWKHDWPAMPAGLAPLELRKIFGLAREVFVVAYQEDAWRRLPGGREPSGLWSVPASAGPDDILLVYRPQASDREGAITDVFRVHKPPQRIESGWRGEPDWMAEIQRIARLRSPITFSRLRELGAQGGLESRPRRTNRWEALYTELTKRGRPTHSLRRYARL